MNKFMSKGKKMLVAAGAAALPAVMFAEGTGSSTVDVSGVFSGAQTALEGLLTSGLPVITALVVTGLTIWGAFIVVRLIMKAFRFGGGR